MIVQKLGVLDKRMGQLVSQGVIPGAVSLVWRRGRVVHYGAHGWQDAETRAPMQGDSLFRIASMTKPIVSVAAMMMWEEGIIAWDDPVAKWIPEIAAQMALRVPDGCLDDVVPLERPVTVRDLLTHRSGLGYPFTAGGPVGERFGVLDDMLERTITAHEWLCEVGRTPLQYQPGERFLYGLSTDLLGFLLERAAGKPLETLLRERILDPLGMRDTTFYVDARRQSRLTAAYIRTPDGMLRVLDQPHASRWANTARPASAGSGLVTTAHDYLAFARLLLARGQNGRARLFSRKAAALMTANYLTVEDRKRPLFGCDFFGGQHLGLGLAVTDDVARRHETIGYASTGSFGWGGLLGTSWLADPLEDMVAVMFVQQQEAGLGIRLNRMLLDWAYDALD